MELTPEITIAYVMDFLSEYSNLKHLFCFDKGDDSFVIITENDDLSEELAHIFRCNDYTTKESLSQLYWDQWENRRYDLLDVNLTIISDYDCD